MDARGKVAQTVKQTMEVIDQLVKPIKNLETVGKLRSTCRTKAIRSTANTCPLQNNKCLSSSAHI